MNMIKNKIEYCLLSVNWHMKFLLDLTWSPLAHVAATKHAKMRKNFIFRENEQERNLLQTRKELNF